MINIKAFAVMADIHSNFEAFRTCINETEKRGIEDYIFLGDYLGDLAYPQKTLDLLKKCGRNTAVFLSEEIKRNTG